MVDVHNPKSQDQFYFCNVSSGGASTKVIGRSQTLSVEVGITTMLSMSVYECPEPVFTPETARSLGILRIPIERLAERYSSGIFQQWFNLDTRSDPRTPAGDPQRVVSAFEQAYTDAVVDVYQPKICLSVIGSAFEVQRGGRQACSIFVGEDVKTQAGPDLKALIASHKQQAAYIDALHEELRRVNTPSYRPMMARQQEPMPPAMPPAQPAMRSAPPQQSVAFASSPPMPAPVSSFVAPQTATYAAPQTAAYVAPPGGTYVSPPAATLVQTNSYVSPVNSYVASPTAPAGVPMATAGPVLVPTGSVLVPSVASVPGSLVAVPQTLGSSGVGMLYAGNTGPGAISSMIAPIA
eukprot:TRINITY_DN496_c0_g2_i1.p1 TRINITY_DN496_c0_g2~~TRINITY_DN496_c0_g2_i1.p1  ORF type:complete len:394 (-),score=40.92 TRINITY_DN496_c0_g2_i1:88-1140(-)